MAGPRTRVVALLALLWCWCVCGQITFSRDWTGGKRAGAAAHAAPNADGCHRYNRICRHFIHELKAAMSAVRVRRGWPDAQQIYYDDR